MGDFSGIRILKYLNPLQDTQERQEFLNKLLELDLAYSYAMGHLETGPSYIEIPTDVLRGTVKDKLMLSDWIQEKKSYKLYKPEDIGCY